MTCISPPELNERVLLRYLDGEADQHVAGHLELCPHCRERARRLAHLQARLTAELYRTACPSPLELGEYHLHTLPRRQSTAVARHLTECPLCSSEVERLSGYLRELAPELTTSAVARIKVLVGELLSAAGEGGRLAGSALAPAYAGVRGEAAAPLLYEAGQAQIAISVQPDSQRPGHELILGLITGMDASAWHVYLWRDGERVADGAVDDLGNFVLAGLAAAVYDLSVSGPDTEIHIQGLDVSPG